MKNEGYENFWKEIFPHNKTLSNASACFIYFSCFVTQLALCVGESYQGGAGVSPGNYFFKARSHRGGAQYPLRAPLYSLSTDDPIDNNGRYANRDQRLPWKLQVEERRMWTGR